MKWDDSDKRECSNNNSFKIYKIILRGRKSLEISATRENNRGADAAEGPKGWTSGSSVNAQSLPATRLAGIAGVTSY